VGFTFHVSTKIIHILGFVFFQLFYVIDLILQFFGALRANGSLSCPFSNEDYLKGNTCMPLPSDKGLQMEGGCTG